MLTQGVVTNQEYNVLLLASQGMQNKEIALKLFILPRTVAKYLQHAYCKLGIKLDYSPRLKLGVSNQELTGGSNLAATLEDAITEIKTRHTVVYTAGFEGNLDHAWELVGYEIFSQQSLKTSDDQQIDEGIFKNVVFCYYRPTNTAAIKKLIEENQRKV